MSKLSEAAAFGMWLTTRPDVLAVGGDVPVYKMLDAIKEWESRPFEAAIAGDQWTPGEMERMKRNMQHNEETLGMMDAANGVTPLRMFLRDVEDETVKARRKFPSSNASLAATMEEMGELAKACLSEHPHRIYREAVQLATMAGRVALEGDQSLTTYRQFNFGDQVNHLAKGERP